MILISQLIAQNVSDFFLAPGSRSTPLAIAAARHPKARLHRHFDERALAFYSAGFGLGKEAPGAIIVTSGTAAGNLTPAIMESSHASIPLIVLTADRPSELKDVSANQTTDQSKMFQNYVRFQCEIDPAMPEEAIRSKIAFAVLRSQFPHPGPVHINCPFREPLYHETLSLTDYPPISIDIAATSALSHKKLPAKGILLIGRLPKRSDIHAVLALAKKLQWPVFGDLLSNARCYETEEMIHHFDWLFFNHPPKAECIVHFGERLVSKRLMEWIGANKPSSYIHVSSHSHWVDPSFFLTERVIVDAPTAAASFCNDPDPTWLAKWKARDRLPPIDSLFTETSAIRSLSHLPLEKWAIFLANSMPIRESDWFLFPKECQGFFSNRGLSGIDGNIATVRGLSLGLNKPVLAILGDVTALHDLNSLALIKQSPHPIILLISNNNGCGIFSHLSVAGDPHFEELFGFPHALEFENAAKMFQIPYAFADSQERLDAAMQQALKEDRSYVIEMKTCRTKNYAHHQTMKAHCLKQT